MAKHEDREGVEMKAVLRLVSFKNKNVLEIGCGNGRLTFEYARLTKDVIGVDPDRSVIKSARKCLSADLIGKVEFQGR